MAPRSIPWRPMPPELRWASEDRRFGVTLGADTLDLMLGLCRLAGSDETGGILIGRYNDNHDTAVVTRVTGAPPDSSATRRGFRRGIRGLRPLLARLWRDRREYYLGEWHYHPRAAARPSATDTAQMRAFAAAPSHKCPEPVLVIVGGDPNSDWTIGASVTHGERLMPLAPCPAPAEAGSPAAAVPTDPSGSPLRGPGRGAEPGRTEP